jgi:hypothetical protein
MPSHTAAFPGEVFGLTGKRFHLVFMAAFRYAALAAVSAIGAMMANMLMFAPSSFSMIA